MGVVARVQCSTHETVAVIEALSGGARECRIRRQQAASRLDLVEEDALGLVGTVPSRISRDIRIDV